MPASTHIGATGPTPEAQARVLDDVLKDECLLSAATRDYRWNVAGPNRQSLHRLLDEQRRQLDRWSAKLRDRAKSSGCGARVALEEQVQAGAADAVSGAGLPTRTMVSDLLSRHEHLAHRLRDNLERLSDPRMEELFRRIVEFHETTAWMLRMMNECMEPDGAK